MGVGSLHDRRPNKTKPLKVSDVEGKTYAQPRIHGSSRGVLACILAGALCALTHSNKIHPPSAPLSSKVNLESLPTSASSPPLVTNLQVATRYTKPHPASPPMYPYPTRCHAQQGRSPRAKPPFAQAARARAPSARSCRSLTPGREGPSWHSVGDRWDS